MLPRTGDIFLLDVCANVNKFSSPHDAQAVGFVEFEIFTFRHDGDFPAHCLLNNEPIKGIPMPEPWEFMKYQRRMSVFNALKTLDFY